jgi:hypothetical protein
MAKIFEKLIFGGLHEKHAVQRGICVPTQHSFWDQGKPRKTSEEDVREKLRTDDTENTASNSSSAVV